MRSISTLLTVTVVGTAVDTNVRDSVCICVNALTLKQGGTIASRLGKVSATIRWRVRDSIIT